jgi:hypothetical protein
LIFGKVQDTAQFLHEASFTALRSLAISYGLALDFDALPKPGKQQKG